MTAYRTPREETPRPGSPGTWQLAAALPLMAALGTLALGADPLGATVTFVAAIAVVALATYPPRRLVWVPLLLLLSVLGLLTVGTATDGGAQMLTWLCGLLAGYLLAIPARSRRAMRRRQRSAIGAASPVREPRGGRDVGLLATWHDGAYEYESPDPDPAVVLDAVRRIGADGHDHVSVYRGNGRLDVLAGGDPDRLQVVFAEERLADRWQRLRPHAGELELVVRSWLAGGSPDEHLTGCPRRDVARSLLATLRRTD